MITASKHIFLKRSSDQWAVGRQLMKRKLTTAQQPTPTPQAWDSFAGWLFLASSDMGLWSYLLSHWRSINEKIPKTVRALARECCVWALAHGLSWSPHNIRPGTVPFLSSPWSGSRIQPWKRKGTNVPGQSWNLITFSLAFVKRTRPRLAEDQ